MRKIMLMALSAMLLLTSMLCVTVTAELPENYPYIYEDFESDPVGAMKQWQKPGSTVFTANNFGVNGSNGSLNVVTPATVGWNDLKFPMTNFRNDVNYESSVQVKLNSDDTYLTNKGVHFILYGLHYYDVLDADGNVVAEKSTPGWRQVNAKQEMVKGEWVKFDVQWIAGVNVWGGQPTAEKNITDAEKELGGVSVRLNKTEYTSFAIRLSGAELNTQAGLEVLDVDIDELMFRSIPVPAPDVVAVDDKTKSINLTFDDDVVGFTAKATNGDPQIVEGIEGNDSKVLKVTIDADNEQTYLPGVELKYNHVYKFSYKMKVESAQTQKNGVFTDVNNAFIYGIYDYGILLGLPAIEATKEAGWNEIEYYAALNTILPREGYKGGVSFRFAAGGKDNTNSRGVYYVDDFKIEDMGGFYNGGFEDVNVAHELGIYERNDANRVMVSGRLAENMPIGWSNGKHISAIDAGKMVWSDSVTTEITNDVPADSTGTNSLKVKVATEGGSVYHGVPVVNDRTYKLTFKAKGVDGQAISAILDRDYYLTTDDVDYQEVHSKSTNIKDKYDAPDKEVLGENWTLSSDWQTYTAVFNTKFDLLETQPASRAGSIARLPLLTFEVNGNAIDTEYYLDDVALEEMANENAPCVNNVEITSDMTPGSTVSVDYDFECLGGGTDASFVKVYFDGAAVGTFHKGAPFTLPFSVLGKEVTFGIVPATAEGVEGVEVAVAAPVASGDWFVAEYDEANKVYNMADSQERTVTVAYASYIDGQLMGLKTQTAKLNAADLTPVYDLEDCAVSGSDIKIFVWDSLTGMKPLAKEVFVSSYNEVATKIHLFGDSLCANYSTTSYPQQGWGYYFQNYFMDKATVVNSAAGGKTAESTYYETWPTAKKQIAKGDYVFISLGINDMTTSKEIKYDETWKGDKTVEGHKAVYDKYLRLLRDEAEALGATVIFTTRTPAIYPNYTTGNVNSLNGVYEWSEILYAVAAEKNNTVLDVYSALRPVIYGDETLTRAEVQAKASDSYDMYYISQAALDRLNEYTDGEGQVEAAANMGDWVHVNVDGAVMFAEVIVDELAKSDNALKGYIKH